MGVEVMLPTNSAEPIDWWISGLSR